MIRRLEGAAIAVMVMAVLLFPYTWWVEGRQDKKWVTKIQAANGHVTKVIRDGDIVLDALDTQALEELDAKRKKLDDELAELRRRQAAPLSDACNQCRIPAYRLWLRE